MTPKRLRERWAAGHAVVAGWLSLDSAYAAELVGSAGFDAVVIDCQHGMAGHAQMVGMLQALAHTPAVPLVRVSGNQLPEINRALDAGAWGVICPLVNSADEARVFGRACRYPLDGVAGDRSFGPARGLLVGGPGYPREANGLVIALAMIETQAALQAVDAIAAEPSIDGLFIGPSDLGIALGMGPGAPHTDPTLAGAIAHIQAAAAAHGKLCGIWCSTAEMARDMVAQGHHLVVPGHDALWLKAEMSRRLAVVRG
jgi:4-hydroxy-2-oxoheptanedioate aldolase